MKYRRIVLLVGALLLVACERQPEQPEPVTREPPTPPAGQLPTSAPPPAASIPAPSDFSVQNLSRGAALYVEHCLQCHGPEGQGHPDWQTPTDGTFVAAPPVNGTGNDWKRSQQELMGIIRQGAKRNGMPVMPGYADRLSDQDIVYILTWLQALWPPDVYERWLRANSGGKASSG
ncbi:MAG: cytochrome c [Acidiferrobacterales bacterium]|nr:cytochrome c [Acidiferrobacterales bacterium]